MEDTQIHTQGNVFSISTHKQLWEHMNTIAKTFIESRAMPSYIVNSAQAMVVLEAGHEMGLQFMESVKYLYLINGSIALTGQGAARKLKDAGYRAEYKDEEDKCTVTVFKGKEEIASETVTFKEADDSGYTKTKDGDIKPGWKPGMNRKLKLRYLGLSIIIKTHLPDVLGSAVDIKEVAEDYPVEEKKKEPLINAEQKASLDEFINKAKDKKNNQADVIEEAEVVEYTKDGKNKIVNGIVQPSEENIKQGIRPKTLGETMQQEAYDKAIETSKNIKENEKGELEHDVNPKKELTAEEVEDALGVTEEEKLQQDPRFQVKQREFFAAANELGLDAEKAKEEVKRYYGGKKHFSELTLMELTAYVRAMKLKIKQRREEANQK